MRIPPAALAALCDDVRLVVGDIRENAVGAFLLDEGAHRHADNQILGVFAAATSASAVLSARRGVLALIAEIGERAEVGIGKKYNVAALAAVAAVGTARGNVFFTVKRNSTVAALYLQT